MHVCMCICVYLHYTQKHAAVQAVHHGHAGGQIDLHRHGMLSTYINNSGKHQLAEARVSLFQAST